jgi:hypothetical protein
MLFCHTYFKTCTTNPASYAMGTGESFFGVKRLRCEADRLPQTSAFGQENVDLYIHSRIILHGVWLN